jgi:hypothetical protein
MIARHAHARALVSSGFVLLTLFSFVVADEPRTPNEVIRPFDQKDLGSFSTWLKKTGREDPEHVFRLDNGVLRCGD